MDERSIIGYLTVATAPPKPRFVWVKRLFVEDGAVWIPLLVALFVMAFYFVSRMCAGLG